MNALTNEIKTRARLLLKLLESSNNAASKRALILSRKQRWDIPEQWQLRHCLNLAAADCGFQHWEHAREVLGGNSVANTDMGDFWHGAEVSGYTNHWFANYAEALAQLQANPEEYLLPYRYQYLVVSADYISALGIAPDAPAWAQIANDLVAGYASASWLRLAQQRMQASRIERFERVWDVQQSALDLQSTEAEAQRVLKSFMQNGRLLKIPEQRKKRLVILQWLVNQLDVAKKYSEPEINRFFLGFHEDYATLRREMIINGLMVREDAVYWRRTAIPISVQ
ncbi:DUF2087 domain-containing protein [Undibacterium sp. Dicai25W]|uniref:DUF2087 domain-containing protein n=1 Tax=Undibacterium sp. Dicai25W TaxID=3413034 RepID=UPI003BF3CD9D